MCNFAGDGTIRRPYHIDLPYTFKQLYLKAIQCLVLRYNKGIDLELKQLHGTQRDLTIEIMTLPEHKDCSLHTSLQIRIEEKNTGLMHR